ncbi:ankyrin repeat domain-containing protein [Methylobacter luteus]|uniref:ankyrin repeat domain-containing protein n=1 Tax=Methylobacter luteus TaxID=415 RepID=UPI0004818224|nr:ankyrin repeat domain-containing protein [Methylobacter luteus]
MMQPARKFIDTVYLESKDHVLSILSEAPELATVSDGEGYTPLMAAVAQEGRDSDIVRRLLECGANANARTSDGYTALHMFYEPYYQHDESSTFEIARLLKDAGAKLEVRTHWSWTPLMAVAAEGSDLEFRALLSIGCNPYVRYGKTSFPVFVRDRSLAEVTVSEPDMVKSLINYRYEYNPTILQYCEERISEAKSAYDEGLIQDRCLISDLELSYSLIQKSLRS